MTVPPSQGHLFESCIHDIAVAYEALGHQLGWRFLSVSRAVLNEQVDIALITLNPGGDVIPDDHPWASCEDGVSYLVEKWGHAKPGRSVLQIQVQRLFKEIADLTGFTGSYEELMEQSLIAYFVPFRSKRRASLHRKAESFDFGRALWSRVLPRVQPRLIICIDRGTERELMRIIPNSLSIQFGSRRMLDTGWGAYTADVTDFAGKGRRVRLLRLPHLSTFKLFTSAKCRASVRRIMEVACKDL